MDSAPGVSWHRGVLAIAGVIATVALWSIWRLEALPLVCPAIYPPPASCATDPHLVLAVSGTAVIGVLLLALVAVRRFTPTAYRALAIAATSILLGLASLVLLVLALLSGSLTTF